MIVGLGTDIVSLDRVRRSLERFGDVFLRKILGPEEMRLVPPVYAARVIYAAGRFAAKEAAAKALGTGFAEGVTMRDIETLSLPSGSPRLFLRGEAARRADGAGVRHIHVSLSHERQSAIAVVILEA